MDQVQVSVSGKEPTCQCRRLKRCRFQSLGREDPLEEEVATRSSILAWKIPWTEKPVGSSPWGCKDLDTTDYIHTGARKGIGREKLRMTSNFG